MPLTPDELETKRTEMIREFAKYREQVIEGFNQVATALSNGEYAHACSIMTTISAHQGQASVNMRTVLVRHGFIVRERSE